MDISNNEELTFEEAVEAMNKKTMMVTLNLVK